jgi:hypothetical protein
MPRILCAAVAVCALALSVTVADARQFCDNDGRCVVTISDGGTVLDRTNRSPTGARTLPGCPAHLGCGCNAAVKFLGMSAQEAKRKGLWLARAFLREGTRASPDCIGCLMVSRRGGRGGHVGKVIGRDGKGNPIVESYGNARVGWYVATYPKSRVLGYVYAGWRSAGR